MPLLSLNDHIYGDLRRRFNRNGSSEMNCSKWQCLCEMRLKFTSEEHSFNFLLIGTKQRTGRVAFIGFIAAKAPLHLTPFRLRPMRIARHLMAPSMDYDEDAGDRKAKACNIQKPNYLLTWTHTGGAWADLMESLGGFHLSRHSSLPLFYSRGFSTIQKCCALAPRFRSWPRTCGPRVVHFQW